MCEQLLSLVKPTLQKGICTGTIKSCLNAICIVMYQNVMNIFFLEKKNHEAESSKQNKLWLHVQLKPFEVH